MFLTTPKKKKKKKKKKKGEVGHLLGVDHFLDLRHVSHLLLLVCLEAFDRLRGRRERNTLKS